MSQKSTLDGYAASYTTVAELQDTEILPKDFIVRTNRYLYNLIEKDHRRAKQRVKPMLGISQTLNSGVSTIATTSKESSRMLSSHRAAAVPLRAAGRSNA